MKTFETEKGNIPEGATHYSNEIVDFNFAWYQKTDNTPLLWLPEIKESWDAMDNPDEWYAVNVLPIPPEYLKEGEPELTREDSPQGIISRISNRLHNMGCEYQNSALGEELGDLACEIWDVLPFIPNESLSEVTTEKEPSQVSWNGEGLPPVGCHCLFKIKSEEDKYFSPCYIIGYRAAVHRKGDMWLVFSDKYDNLYQHNVTKGAFEFRPIETPEQKQERELLESAYDLYKVYMEENDPNNLMTFKQFKNNIHLEYYKGFLNIVNKFSFNKKEK